MKIVILLFVIISLLPRAEATAQQSAFDSNAWGFYFSPTTHRVVSAPTKYEMFHTNTGEDVGLYYCRSLRPFWRLQTEKRYGGGHRTFRLTGQGERNISRNTGDTARQWNAPNRQIAYEDICGSRHVEQEVAFPGTSGLSSSAVTPIDMGGYQKYGWVLDGGCSLLFTARGGIFASYRITKDQGTVSRSDDLAVNPKYHSYGFQIGFEFNFGSWDGSC
jgi:hypothetical protein